MLKNVKNLITIVVLLTLLPISTAWCMDFVPVVTNYTSTEYNGGLQNWDISQDAGGTMYIANNNGVLVYDGYTWQKFSMPGNALVRSVLCDGDRIYVGSTQEFGYMSADGDGYLQYHSLWKLIKGYTPHNDEIWRIIKDKSGKIIFQSFCSWFEYDGKTVQFHYNPKQTPLFFYKVSGEIYAQLIHSGLYKLQHGQYSPILSRESVNNDDVTGILPYRNGSILLFTQHSGLFVFDGTKVIPFHTSADNLLKSGLINRVTAFRHGNGFVVGTVNDGVMAFDNNGNLLWRYNTASLLDNNTVLGLYCDRQNNIWVACDIGIALVHSGSPYSALGDNFHPLGMVFDIMNTTAGLYVATNQATYLYRNGMMAKVAGTDGQNWHISSFGGKLIVGNNKGILHINGLNATWLPESGYSSSTALHRLSTNDQGTGEYIIESTYSDLCIYQDVGGKLFFRNIVKGFTAPIKQFQIDAHGNIWAVNMVKGMYCIKLSPDMRRVEKVKYIPSLDASSVASPINVTKLLGTIIFSDGVHIRRLSENGKLVPYDDLERLTHGDIISATRVDNERAWIASSRGYMLISSKSGKLKSLIAIPATFFNSECSDNNNKVYVNGNYAYLCMNDVIGRVDMRQNESSNGGFSKLWIRHTESIKPDGSGTVPIAINGSDPAIYGNVTITLGFANYSREQLSFVYTLEGNGKKIKGEKTIPVLSFSNLSYGSYALHVDVTDANGRVLNSIDYSFHYPRPMYLSWFAWCLYILVFLTISYFVTRWLVRRTMAKKQAQMEEERIRQELRIAEQNRIIEEQKKQLLEEQLKDKGKEIASLTMSGIRQKQQMKEIREELNNGSHKLSKQSIQSMLSHITDDADTDTYWDIYNENFDLIHKNFFRNLRKLNPSLTANDMKFCALLRLNLSTKEIAKFTGLTLRGVEGARYRLRRKLNIPKDQSITQFLLDIA